MGNQFNLNEKQKEAVEFNGGDLLIIAGAGTGKTQVITKRILHIINEGWAKPSEILALTFMEKAAQEMQERVDMEADYGYEEPFIATFHSFCDTILKEEGYNIGLDEKYVLMTTAQEYIFLRKYIHDLPLKTLRPRGNPRDFLNSFLKHVARLQDEDISPKEYIQYVSKLPRTTEEEEQEYLKFKELAESYKKYSELKIENSKINFGDLITLTLSLFRERKNVLEKYRRKFKYILVDEFQDTNYNQNMLINILVGGNGNSRESKQRPLLTVVGDDDQSIYKFRGAAISNILQFKQTYPDAKKIVLTENYRSRQEILDSAYALIKHNDPDRLEVTEGIDKKLVARGAFEKDENPVNLITATCEEDEAEKVANEIMRLTGYGELVEETSKNGEVFDATGQSSLLRNETLPEGKYKFSDIAILVRANSHADAFTQMFRYKGIPYKLGGTRGLYFRKEIKTLISFIHTLVNPTDDIAMYQLLSLPMWKLNAREFLEINKLAREKRQSVFEQLEQLWNIHLGETEKIDTKKIDDGNVLLKKLSPDAIAGVGELLEVLNSGIIKMKECNSIFNILYDFVMNSGFLRSILGNEETVETQFITQNISKYLDLVKQYEKNNPDSNMYEYVEFLDYSIESGDSPLVDSSDMEELNAVNIITVHGSKGLEFPVVFMVSLVAQRFPAQGRNDSIPIPDALIKEFLDKDVSESESNIREERRLFYVGATRAKERLYLTAANFYGDAKRKKKPSIFLQEILSRKVDEDFDLAEKKPVSNSLSRINLISDDSYEMVIARDKKINFAKKFSYSRYNTYEQCPRKYLYEYVIGIPQRQYSATAFGTTIHNTLKDFYEMVFRFQHGLEGIFSAPTVEDLLRLYEKNWVSNGYESQKQEEDRKKEGKDILQRYYNEIYSPDERPFKLEEGLDIHIGNTTFVGKIDRIDSLGSDEKEVLIIDYKTGSEKKSSDIKKDLQLPLYAFLVEQKLGLKVVGAKYIFVEVCKVVNVDISEKRREEAKEKVLESIDLIREGKFDPIANIWNCRHCDYNSICKYAEL
ncbi:MAG TPA: ATP-dependent DNA helicase [Candidatus Dojkabacteria bacterium]|nr:ATP-dependent DNA helicase [Candidatus Dojkabacteria bacterium]